MYKIISPIALTIFLSVLVFSEENDNSEPIVDNNVSFFKFLGVSKIKNSHAPVFKNDQNLSDYRWNALETKWVNAYALLAIIIDRSIFSQNDESIAHVGDLSPFDRGDIRAIRVGALGTINFEKPWTWVIAGATRSWDRGFDVSDDDADETFTFFDVALSIPLWGDFGRMSIGKMKEPGSMERTMGMVFEQTMERPMHLDALLPSRNTGITLNDVLLDERMTWKAGIFNNWFEQDNVSFSEMSMQYVGRVTGLAYENKEALRLLHLGATYRYSDGELGIAQYQVGPEQSYVGAWLDTGILDIEDATTYNLEMTYLDGPLWLAAEYTNVDLSAPLHGNPSFDGYHVAANYIVTGEHRGYNNRNGTVRHVIPEHDFTNGGWGALELSARYSTLDLNAALVQAGEMQITTVGVIWHTQKASQFHLQYSRAHLESLDLATRTIPLESDTDIVQFRWVYFLD